MPVKVEIRGLRDHILKMEKRHNRIKGAVAGGLVDWAQLILDHARESIIEGGIPSPNHIPSRPGEPPNADTHALDMSGHLRFKGEGTSQDINGRIDYDADGVSIEVEVVFGGPTAPYAVYLEFGTVNMIERPYLLPASVQQRSAGKAKLDVAILRALRNG